MHALVTTQIRELRVRFETNFALKRFHRRMNVRVLLQTRLCGKCFTAFGTRMTAGTDVTIANVSLQIRWVGEYLWAIEKRERKTLYLLIFY